MSSRRRAHRSCDKGRTPHDGGEPPWLVWQMGGQCLSEKQRREANVQWVGGGIQNDAVPVEHGGRLKGRTARSIRGVLTR